MKKRLIRTDRLLRTMHLLRFILPSRLPQIHRQNAVELYRGGDRFFPALFEALRGAKKFILAEYYIVRSDRTGSALASELAGAVKRGVRVYLIYDYIGSIDSPAAFFRNLAAAGVETAPFNVPSFHRGLRWFDRRDHRKMTIVDGEVAFLGGFNIGDEYAGLAADADRFYDLGISIRGSAVEEFMRIFSETWRRERGDPPDVSGAAGDGRAESGSGNGDVAIVSGGPGHRHSRIRNVFLVHIAAASDELLIVTPYFIPGPRMIRALMRAARRGVRVRLLLPARSDMPFVRLLARAYYDVLLREGIEIRELEEEILHAKAMLIDGKQAVIGSANLDQRSFHRNFEIAVLIRDDALAGSIRAIYGEDFRRARTVLLKDHERRGLAVRILERLIGLFGWFL